MYKEDPQYQKMITVSVTNIDLRKDRSIKKVANQFNIGIVKNGVQIRLSRWGSRTWTPFFKPLFRWLDSMDFLNCDFSKNKMQKPIGILLAAVLFTGMLKPMLLGAQSNDGNATSTDPIAGIDTATTTDDGTGTATTTDEVIDTATTTDDGAVIGDDSGVSVPEMPVVVPTGKDPLSGPKTEAETVQKIDPLVMAVWAMRENGTDDSPEPFAQILPSGEQDVDSQFRICGAVRPGTDVDGGFGVYSQFSYPKDAAFAPNDPAKRSGCGQAVSPLCQMKPLESSAGLELFCRNIKKNNGNLPVFAAKDGENKTLYDYDAICGEIEKKAVSVYCCDQSLAYDDISGIYQASVVAQNAAGKFSNLLITDLDYLPVTSFVMDFSTVSYGTVAANVAQSAHYYADDDHHNLGAAFIRNTGNTRLQVSIEQNDMGLGKTDGAYNVRYQARYASGNGTWTYYAPDEPGILPGELDLSENKAIDLGVTVLKYPDKLTKEFSGSLVVNGLIADHHQCIIQP